MPGQFKDVTWEWIGDCKLLDSHNISGGGYGQIHCDGKLWGLHRLVWTHANGPIPKGMQVLHSCDRPACFNLAHLSLGTQKENMRQMNERGRGRRPSNIGVKNSHAKMTEKMAWIARYHAHGIDNARIARALGVGKSAISKIRCNTNWKHMTESSFTLGKADLDFIQSLRCT